MKMGLSRTRLERNQNKAGSHSGLAWKFWFRFFTRRTESIFVEISDLWLCAPLRGCGVGAGPEKGKSAAQTRLLLQRNALNQLLR